jgi:hypothetical protein
LIDANGIGSVGTAQAEATQSDSLPARTQREPPGVSQADVIKLSTTSRVVARDLSGSDVRTERIAALQRSNLPIDSLTPNSTEWQHSG